MIEALTLGALQGITEWLPISSDGVLTVVKLRFFGGEGELHELIRSAMFLHLGTFASALVYFRKDVLGLLQTFLSYRSSSLEEKALLNFLFLSSLVTGIIGLLFLVLLNEAGENALKGARIITLFTGVMLLVTSSVLFLAKKNGRKEIQDLKTQDAFIVGFMQALAILPGISRSGFTIASLLLRGFNDTASLRASFLMSLPAVLGANIVLNLSSLPSVSPEQLVSLATAFLFGIGTIHILLKIAQKLNFAKFVFLFGIVTIAFAFL